MATSDGGEGDDDNSNDNSSLFMRTSMPGTVLSIQHAPCNNTEMGSILVPIIEGRTQLSEHSQ